MSATDLAHQVITELIKVGVREIVLAPGSRNAPLSFAVHAADRQGLARLHVRIDERDAGFLALGLAKASGMPVPVITTSGTAVANLTPALWEAAHTGIPIVVISADRPLRLLEAGVSQVTRQDGAFARFVRAEIRLEDGVTDTPAVRHHVRRLVARATGRVGADPGPVHLNLGFDVPLVPSPGDSAEFLAAAPPQPESRPAVEPETVLAGPRTVLLVGDAPPSVGRAAHAAARAANVPVLAEPSSNGRHPGAVATYRLLLNTELGRQIERVVMIGHPTLSRPMSALISRDDLELITVQEQGDWTDPGQRSDRLIPAVAWEPADRAWDECWRTADAELSRRLAAYLAQQPTITGHELAARTIHHARGNLVFGASQLIRDADLAPIAPQPADTYANRGLGGIDGTVATAMGIGLATNRPTTVLLGDLTVLHDAGGLLVGPEEPTTPLRLVVGNDRGGAIFHTLEQGAPSYAAAFERTFGTPHQADFGALARAYGWQYRRVTSSAELEEALSTEPAGLEMIEVPLDRQRRRLLDAELKVLIEAD